MGPDHLGTCYPLSCYFATTSFLRMNPLEIISARWVGGPIEFLITAAMPFVLLIAMLTIFVLRGTRLPTAFYAAAVLAAFLGLLYAPTCGCMGFQQIIGAAGNAFVISGMVFLPFIVRFIFAKPAGKPE